MSPVGPIGSLGRYTATHFRVVAVAWAVVAVALGVLAPKVEHALSGAGWEATGSESLQARELVDRNFQGLSSSALQVVVHSPSKTVADPAFQQSITSAQRTLEADPRVASVMPPRLGQSISRDGHTAVIQAGAAGNPNEMVRAADDLKTELKGAAGVQVSLTGASGMWSDFNEANRSAMLKSEVISWPVTMVILVLAFGSLVAAGLPLMLTILGLVASAGSLYIGTQLLDISIWAMNFALMFALALGIDYALFIVMRFRGAFFGSQLSAEEAVAETMDTAGKAVLFSGVTVLISLTAVMLVPSPAFRSMALGPRGGQRAGRPRHLPLASEKGPRTAGLLRGLARSPRRVALRRPGHGHEGLLDARLRASTPGTTRHRRRGGVREAGDGVARPAAAELRAYRRS